jgi:hypothetical protein
VCGRRHPITYFGFRGSGFPYFFGTDFTDYAVLLCGGQDFAFYLNAFSEVYQQAYFYAGGFQVVDELGAVRWVKVFD